MFSTIKKMIFLLFGPIVIADISAWVYLHGGRHVTIDNVFIKAKIEAISPEISGKVVEAYTADNARVHAGNMLFRLARPMKLP
jgi:membrane fusion protein (multidrug efflux system)